VLAYCPICDHFGAVQPGEWVERPTAQSGGRRAFHPVPHREPPTHDACGGKIAAVLRPNGDASAICEKCAAEDPTDTTPGKHCPGKAIR